MKKIRRFADLTRDEQVEYYLDLALAASSNVKQAQWCIERARQIKAGAIVTKLTTRAPGVPV